MRGVGKFLTKAGPPKKTTTEQANNEYIITHRGKPFAIVRQDRN